ESASAAVGCRDRFSSVMETLTFVANVALTAVAAGLALLAAYLMFLTLAAALARKSPPVAGPGQRRFAILVPAHNEEVVIGRLLRSLAAVDYQRFDVCVVADNCDDATAEIARGHG